MTLQYMYCLLWIVSKTQKLLLYLNISFADQHPVYIIFKPNRFPSILGKENVEILLVDLHNLDLNNSQTYLNTLSVN